MARILIVDVAAFMRMMLKDFLTKAKENMQLIEEQKRMKQNASVGGQK